MPRRIAVLDVGKTNVKLVVVDAATRDEIWVRTVPNTIRRDGPYPHADVAMIEAFLVDALADATAAVGIDAVSITTHGATGALIGPEGLVLPVLDYEHDGPDAVDADYAQVRPAFAESFSPRLPGGLNLGAQLFWQARCFPEAFARATHFVTYPQFWAWRLTGVAATEPTSLGCHTDLWAPGQGRFSSLVDRMGWGRLMAPVRSAFDVLGTVRPDLADRVGLGRTVPVACGLHDSNASLLPYIQGSAEPRTILSTGTWIIAFAVGGALDRLDAGRDMLANVDAYGRPVPAARFMGGREFDHLIGGPAVEPDPDTLATVLARGVMALPGFARGSGPFPEAVGAWSHDPDSLTPAARTAAASLYAALMTATCLDRLGADGPIFVEGPFARNGLYGAALARLTGRAVHPSSHRTGTSGGAARLFAPGGAEDTYRPGLLRSTVGLGSALDAYAARWRNEVFTRGSIAH
ncbi:FGGY-family carbohydrate kinase [Methylobacterium phyllostachyos]|uniref:FGGY-family carbohydrate kinase n=1 Tax=Methylobacterium phyllostachyos TaxID=582672 RepID=UPI000B8473D8|nr:FGGY-family carbohydrate kinase [Methylobacterium phyllostachyos]